MPPVHRLTGREGPQRSAATHGRSGGLAGVTRQAAPDTSGRPDAADLERLALAAVADSRAVPAPGVPDGFQHTVTVTTASGCTTLGVVR